MTAETPDFWSWTLARWQGVAATELLELQDAHGVVILEIMFVAWLGQRQIMVSPAGIALLRDRTQAWIDEVIVPLRAVRRAWKTSGREASLRQRLQGLELEAERALAGMYMEVFDDLVDLAAGHCSGAPAKTLRHNLVQALSAVGLADSGAVLARLENHLAV